ncbi:hypothetical protein GOP47_0006263 [Adiantum capillus-veneris]|uniref:Tetratricopeptide repeat protein 1 n=1 Tax=Adiantum capillus-veneris TaxID=13818 RepID=A0A9D4ZLV4_ADICA|nr:hypothetical protein GOP47_0006263 [Adiantum capillus-veneris]
MVTIELAPDEPSTSSVPPQNLHARNLRADEADIASRDEDRRRKHEDDDWETASEGEDAEDRHGDSTLSTANAAPESFEDALTEEEQKQRALSQAVAAKAEGNTLYAAGKCEDALACYTNALESLPEHETSNEIRAMCHSNSAACFFQMVPLLLCPPLPWATLQLHVLYRSRGSSRRTQYKEAVEHATKALESNPAYIKALMRRAQSHEKLDNLDEALADYNKVLEFDLKNQQARAGARRLEPIVAERREKLKEEMIAKLKDLGNTVLGKFGMSVDNFKAVQDPNTGSYSISFQK